jgi:hypothetical protein
VVRGIFGLGLIPWNGKRVRNLILDKQDVTLIHVALSKVQGKDLVHCAHGN